MNERIEQLAGQVCDTLHDGDWNIPDEFIEKFAKLLIQECAKVADEEDGCYPYDTFEDKFNHHLGVEE